MGGNLFSERRIGAAEYEEICTDVLSKIDGRIPCSFKDKKDFGDIDICVPFPLISEDYLRDKFGVTEFHYNSSVISFPYRETQVDICHFLPEDLESAINYMSWGDTSMMVGVIFNQLGFRLTHRGLTFPIKLNQADRLGELIISKDFRKIFDFINLSYTKWVDGFEDEQELFTWLTQSKYFNKDFFKFENLRHQNRTRNRKRKTYGNFVQYCLYKEFQNNYVEENKQYQLIRALYHFGSEWFSPEPLLEVRRRMERSRNVFSGHDVQKILDFKLTGRQIGDTLEEFKKYLAPFASDFADFGKDQIYLIFKDWYKDKTKR